MPMHILSERDKMTPIRLLRLMPDWGDEGLFQQIWGEQLGSHFWRKFTIERGRNVNNFILELDSDPEQQLWHFLVRQSKQSHQNGAIAEPKNYMIFYRRNALGMPFEFISLPMLALTHEFICNIQGASPLQAMFEMHPDTWDVDHDCRTQVSIFIDPKEISEGDVILEYDDFQITNGWMVKYNEDEGLYLEELPPW